MPRRPLFAQVVEHNIASRTVLQRAGFTQIGMTTVVEDGEEICELEFILGAETDAQQAHS